MSKNDDKKPFWSMFAAKNGKKNTNSRRSKGDIKTRKSDEGRAFGNVKNEINEDNPTNDDYSDMSFTSFKPKKRKRIVVKNDEFDQMPFCGVPIRLPVGLKPYPSQKLIMVRVLTALKNSYNVLAESPTGSGKTMALLASTCGWLKMYQDERREARLKCEIHGGNSLPKMEIPKSEMEKSINSSDADTSIVNNTSQFENQWVEDFVPQPGKVEKDPKVELKSEIKEDDQVFKEDQQPICTCLPRIRIYYGTRTHKQISQVVKEFSRLPYAGIIKHTILASREQSCVNPVARKSADISHFCKEVNSSEGMGCSFKTNMRNRFEKAAPLRSHLENNGSIVFDTEEIIEVLATSSPQLCPYFCTTRILTQDADLIFCPFSYLVDPIIRNSSDVHLKNSIIILDEAHNIEDTCRDAASFVFSEKELDDTLYSFKMKKNAIDEELESKRNEFDGSQITMSEKLDKLKEMRQNLISMEHLTVEIMKWLRTIAVNARETKNGRDGVKTCTLSSENLFCSLTNVEQGIDLYTPANTPKYCNILATFNALAAHNEGEMQFLDAFKPSATAIVTIEKWLYFQQYFGQPQYQMTYRVNASVEPIQQGFMRNSSSNNKSDVRRKSAGPRNMKYANDEFSNSSIDVKPSAWLSENVKKEEDDNDDNETWLESSKPPTGIQPFEIGCKTSISLWCMSPALSFIDAFRDSRSVILASGTLCPMETLKTELGMEFKQQMEGDQVISSDRIFAAVLPMGPFGNRIQCTYRHTADADSPFYSEIGAILRYVCTNVSAGILCFLPSYRVLDNLKNYMERSSSMRMIEMKKVVLFEPRRSSDLASVMTEFDEAIFNPKKFGNGINGALMFAVFRGKVSEGIDFADDRARVVVSVGIPFPNSADELVSAKRVYNDENCKKLGILNGEEWYVTQAYRALNQALGRCLRHRNDWGAMLMLDERLERQCGNNGMSSGAASAKVSKWIRGQLKSYPSFNQFNEEFRNFFERMTIEKKDVKTD